MKYIHFLVVLAMSSPVFAEPSPVFRHLLTDPVSMLDWGLYRLREALDDIEFENLDERLHSRRSDAWYDWERNRVILHYTIYLNKASSNVGSAKEACSQITEHLRTVWGHKFTNIWNVSTFFEHSGFSRKSRPENFSNTIQNATYIEITAFGTDKSSPPYPPYSQLLICENPLMGKGVFSSESTD